MGVLDVHRLSPGELGRFARALLRDLAALEAMLAAGSIESGQRRIGCEQELFLVDDWARPRPVALELLEALDDPAFTTELGRFNLELNLECLTFTGDALSRMEANLAARLGTVRRAARQLGAEVVLTGILPTLRKSDLVRENLTPLARYRALDEALRELGGGRYELRLSGSDELIVEHDSVMLESCCTSFQIHYQVDPGDFAHTYNVAQAVTAPLLAVSVNSPLLFGRKLWQETRVPLFQQSIDTRQASGSLRERSPRVNFGHRWVDNSVVELFREEISRLPILLGAETGEDSLEVFRRGESPALRALRIHNGTIYRWNRPCYGVLDGAPHLRIENRVLPAGPTVRDEIANAAFFFGLLRKLPELVGDLRREMAFEDCRRNFFEAARSGLESQFRWLGGRIVPARELILEELLPVAYEGLEAAGIDQSDRAAYLGVVRDRAESRRTGASWLLTSAAAIGGARREQMLTALTRATLARQWEGAPIHRWTAVDPEEGRELSPLAVRVEEAMTTDLLTVRPEEPVELARSLMDWHRVRHLPVEDLDGRLVGILASDDLADLRPGSTPVPVAEVMNGAPEQIGPEFSIAEAARRMAALGVDYLVVVAGGRLAGILTRVDIDRVTGAGSG